MYRPESGSLADRVCCFFIKHPEEELSSNDIARKFDVPAKNVTASLTACVTHELLQRAKDASGISVWVAGPNLAKTTPAPVFPYIAKTRSSVAGLPKLDVKKLQVRFDVPVPEKRQKGRTRYDELFDLLDKPGTSVLLERSYAASVLKAAQQYSKRTNRDFKVRVVNDEQCGVWRTA
jgi:hypothetical protein